MRPQPRLFRASCQDGWKIALHHYGQRPARDAKGTVVLCHGLSVNRHNLDAPGELSVARFLHRHGWDVWVIELRGAGKSSKPRPWNRRRFDWGLDEYVRQDMPAALDFIRKHSGQETVHWIGHSLGGMLGYAYLCMAGNAWAASMITIGSPSMRGVRNPYMDKFASLRPAFRLLRRTPHASLAGLFAPLVEQLAPWTARLVVNPDNMNRGDIKTMVRVASENIPTRVIEELWSWYDGPPSHKDSGFEGYSSHLDRITAPLYVIAGSDDRLTPPDDCKIVYNMAASRDKRFDVFGTATGCQHDYGHIDLVLGKHARDEVWPHILEWLDAHRTE
jgi:pimeloyl-ACP methyl ester carboxylesterase